MRQRRVTNAVPYMSFLPGQHADLPPVNGNGHPNSPLSAVRIVVRGTVQGVGFRPFVYRLARDCHLAGRVRNAITGVWIELEGDKANLSRFQDRLVSEAPPAAEIDEMNVEPIVALGCSAFTIDPSDPSAPPRVRLPRDLATCPNCRRELFDPANRRRDYPFTNCTDCGPRYSIITAMPYDRPYTVMRLFTMCEPCDGEYHTPDDRRFHAQPNACSSCGPQVALWDRDGRTTADPDGALKATAELLRQGKIVALKGLGGFQLLVRADESAAVARLRQRKSRPSKPLAVMTPTLEMAESLATIGPLERRLLTSARNPIVLLESSALRPSSLLAPEVAPKVGTLGLFLPTTPLHHLLLADLKLPIVATSGNLSEEPIVTDEREALQRLGGIADAFLVHNRPIVRRVDDSVLRVIAGRATMIRLARGYAPQPLPALERMVVSKAEAAAADPCLPILAAGGHQKSAVALWSGTQALLAQHVGDLDGPDTRASLDKAARDMYLLYQFDPAAVACDLHPDYFTTPWAFAQGKPVVQVQHHHAHAVSCMVENDLLDREVLALTWDGTGFGPDGTIWGGEVMQARWDGYERVGSLLPFPLPGGEAAIKHPGRVAFGLFLVLLGEEVALRDQHLHQHLGLTPNEARLLATMVRRGVQTPWTSSVGRLFDAVAALVLGAREVTYEGEAAIWLEAVADPAETGSYPLPLVPADACPKAPGDRSIPRADWRPLLTALREDIERDVDVRVVAARFHNTLAQWGAAAARQSPLGDVVLSGGCFQNRLLTERAIEAIAATGKRVHVHDLVPPGDGGLAAGQLAVAMASFLPSQKR